MFEELRDWQFQVSCHVDLNEVVCVTGSCKQLGSWNVENVIPLESETTFTPGKADSDVIWRTSLKLPSEQISYRYCVCAVIQKDGSDEINYIIRKWETHLQPRTIPDHVSNISDPSTEIFGISSGLQKVDQGWLDKESLIEFLLYKSPLTNDPVVLWKRKHKEKKCYVKITPVFLKSGSTEPPLLSEESTEADIAELRMKSQTNCPVIEVAVSQEGHEKFKPQNQFGVVCSDDGITFQCRIDYSKPITFLVDYYIEMNGNDIPQYIGCSFILLSHLKEDMGVTTLPIMSQKHVPIGQLTAHYLQVHPLKNFQCDMALSYTRYWKNSWRGLEVGHRGAGNSYHLQTKNCANIRENTIQSLKYAAENGADMVEFDVQLTKDFVPVLYHDFHVYITLKRKKEPLETDLMWIPVKDLTLDQLQALKLYHRTEKGTSKFDDDHLEDHQPFPTLERAMNSVPETCGFNLEVKWNMIREDGSKELDDPITANKFLDIILEVVLRSETHRKIVFSCFNPNICTMLRAKQNRYPVLFLTSGPFYDDFRTKSMNAAIYFASSIRLLGINPKSDLIFKELSDLQLAYDKKLVVFTWGDQNSDRAVVDQLSELGVHAIIYDKIDVYSNNVKKSSVFLCTDSDASDYCLIPHSANHSSISFSASLRSSEENMTSSSSKDKNRPTNFLGVLDESLNKDISVNS